MRNIPLIFTLTECFIICFSLKGAGFPVHLLPMLVDSGSIAGQTCSEWHGIPANTHVGAALGDFQCSVYSCMTDKTDAGMFVLRLSLYTLVEHKLQNL